MMADDTEKYTDGRVVLTIQLSGEISGQSIKPFLFTVSKIENITPKNRTKQHAQWRLEESIKNCLSKVDEAVIQLKEKVKTEIET
jgi:hypothetical protein